MRKFLFLLLFITLDLFSNERIVALSPSINEIIFALGSGNEVVGNTEYCTYPEASQKVAKVGGYFSPSLEKILSLKPSLVIMQKNNYKLSQKLYQLGIQTKIVKIDTLENIRYTIRLLGETLHKKKEAQKILNDIETALESLKNITTNKKVLVVIGHNTSLASRVFVAGQNLYFDDIIKASGNTNALQSKRSGQPILNAENIIATQPEIVILLAHSMKERGLSRADLIDPWKALPIPAAKSDAIYIIDKKYAGIPSDRLVYFINDFKTILEDVHIKELCQDRTIISQSPYITYLVDFFEMKECIVGASVYDAEVSKELPRTGKVIDPDAASIAKLNADFLFTSDWTSEATLKTITPKSTKALRLKSFDSMRELSENLHAIAKALKIKDANNKITTFEQEWQDLTQSINAKNKRVLLLSACSKETYSYGTNTYLGDLFSKAGFILPDNAKKVRHFTKEQLDRFIEKEKIDFIFGFVPYTKATTCQVLETQKKLPIIYLNGDNFMHPAPAPLLRGLEELRSKQGEW